MKKEKKIGKDPASAKYGKRCKDIMGVKIISNNCINDCEKRQFCDNCGKQLCQKTGFQDYSAKDISCSNEGYYNTANGSFCCECYQKKR